MPVRQAAESGTALGRLPYNGTGVKRPCQAYTNPKTWAAKVVARTMGAPANSRVPIAAPTIRKL